MNQVMAIASGWLLWAAVFTAIYALHGLGCAIGADKRVLGPVTLLQAMLGAVWLVAIAAALIALVVLRRVPERLGGGMPRRIAAVGWVAALGAILLTGSPIVFPSGCT